MKMESPCSQDAGVACQEMVIAVHHSRLGVSIRLLSSVMPRLQSEDVLSSDRCRGACYDRISSNHVVSAANMKAFSWVGDVTSRAGQQS
jgi:hypothetical protein